MKKLLLLIVILIPLLTGCKKDSDEIIANESEFSVVFENMDFEHNIATFTINGFANDEEFSQINSIIIDSLKNQQISDTVKVNVFAQAQSDDEDPIYGTAEYKNGKLTNNEIENISIDEYIDMTNK